jgi:hypothetical protein
LLFLCSTFHCCRTVFTRLLPFNRSNTDTMYVN